MGDRGANEKVAGDQKGTERLQDSNQSKTISFSLPWEFSSGVQKERQSASALM